MENVQGHLVLLMGPTGSGKGSLVTHIKETVPEACFAISCTTRDKRPHETEGVEYHFVSEDTFEKKVSDGDFLEWAEFSGKKYGTLKSEIVGRLENNELVLNEIELQGVQQLLPIIPEENRTLVYIEAGGWEVLKARAVARAPISDEHLELRRQRFVEEEKMKPYADVVIDNADGNLDQAKKEFEALLKEKLKTIS